MADSNFIDYVKICCRSGKGGAGSAHMHRSKITAKGGPDGGDGGHGGNIYMRGNTQLWTLIHLKYKKHIIATPGINGNEGNKTGKKGEDIYLDVPLGTIARDAETGEKFAEIVSEGQVELLLAGGRGGLGNWNFRSSTNQAPTYSQPGEPGQEKWNILELKVLADVGLVGLPNAGKSTLLAAVSAAKPKIADYAFTTLTPNIGIVPYRDYKSFIMADIPGIIKGASDGKGLGIRFLRHIERNSILLFLIPSDSLSYYKEYKMLCKELERYNPELMHKKHIISISKEDISDPKDIKRKIKRLPEDRKSIVFSAATQTNLEQLKDLIWAELND